MKNNYLQNCMFKILFHLLFLCSCMNLLFAQNIPVISGKPKPTATKPPTKTSPKPKSKPASTSTPVSNVPAGPTQTIKFLSDADGELYIDGEYKGKLTANVILRVKLLRGEYLLRVVGASNKQDQLTARFFVQQTGGEQIQMIGLNEIIQNRLRSEKSEMEEREKERQRKQGEEQRKGLLKSRTLFEVIEPYMAYTGGSNLKNDEGDWSSIKSEIYSNRFTWRVHIQKSGVVGFFVYEYSASTSIINTARVVSANSVSNRSQYGITSDHTHAIYIPASFSRSYREPKTFGGNRYDYNTVSGLYIPVKPGKTSELQYDLKLYFE